MPGIFISHASADEPLVDPFVDYLLRLGSEVPKEFIFYSSGDDTGIPSGRTLNDSIRSKIDAVSLVVAIISPTFQTRPFCVAELGAAWSHVGKLFPIAVPGLEHTDMDGVLAGLVVRYLNDSSALDEMHDLVSEALGLKPNARTWGRYKAKWLANVDEYARALAMPRIIAPEDYDRAVADLEGTKDALRDAESVIREQARKIELLAAAKSAQDVSEIMVPKSERERFAMLVRQAEQSLKRLPPVVREAVRYQYDGQSMPSSDLSDDSMGLEADECYKEGWLKRAGTGMRPNFDFDEVSEAMNAIRRLGDFLDSSTSATFREWFRAQHHTAPDLRLRRVWNQIFRSDQDPLR